MDITPITVEQLNNYIKKKMDGDEFLNSVYVKGEISNFKLHYTGHMYFTLKDEKSLIKCIMFRSYTPHLSFMPKDGMKVVILGSVSVFERDGVYQIYCKAMKQDGMGSLFEAYEKLKAQLEKEGLFNEKFKKSIPKYPKTIGVLTASTGAVIRDIINVSTRRNPNVHIRLLPVPVQGPTAAGQIVEGIKRMNQEELADVIILGRGGGSLEDLWPFNEEIVARAIFESEIPIISAVGHETDFSISDFVADLRAPTPSAAAELAVPNIIDVKKNIEIYENRYKNSLNKKVELMKLRFEKCMNRKAFTEPTQKVNELLIALDMLIKRNTKSVTKIMNEKSSEFVKIATRIDTLSPLKTLTRGYTIVEKDEKVINSINQIKINDNIGMRFNDGRAEAKITKIIND
ncbi:MAG: exodeoxyribonuclease VII large subunit [Clostridia bacterium]|nr:exodeoxyribonuclease VII large subunit [Clostridia bacterium]